MGSRGGVGCFGAVALLVVVSMIISLIVFLVGIAAVVAGLAGAGWLLYSAATDLGRRRRLTEGSDPLQASGVRAHEIASASHLESREVLSATLASWHHLTVTRAIGTPLQGTFDRLEQRALTDPVFQDLLLRAETAHSESVLATPSTASDLARQTVEMDQLTAELRESVHRMGRGETPAPGRSAT